MNHSYAVGMRFSWLDPIGNLLTGIIEELGGKASGNPMYWMRVDGSRPGYYPGLVIVHEKEFRTEVNQRESILRRL